MTTSFKTFISRTALSVDGIARIVFKSRFKGIRFRVRSKTSYSVKIRSPTNSGAFQPPASNILSSDNVCSVTFPCPFVVWSSVELWIRTGTPSWLKLISTSTISTSRVIACSIAECVFSGAGPEFPRWAMSWVFGGNWYGIFYLTGLALASIFSTSVRLPCQGPGCSCFRVVIAAAKRQASCGGALKRLPR